MKNKLPQSSMKLPYLAIWPNVTVHLLTVAFLFLVLGTSNVLRAQQLQMSDFALFSGSGTTSGCSVPVSPGASVQIGCNSIVNGGAVGSLNLIQTTGAATISGNLHSREKIDLAANCTLTGKITASNSASASGTILSVASGATIGGNMDVKGNIVVAGGTIYGAVTHPAGTTYTGPTPAGGNITGTPSLPTFPSLPAITTFSPSVSSPIVSVTQTLSPGNYGEMTLTGGKIITLNGAGTYVFNKVLNQSDNDLIFDFKNNATGVFKIYIHNDADFGQIHAKIINGGSATRIYTEVHGNGSTSSNGTIAFLIDNCSGLVKSSWLGTVWAPYGAIKIGSLSGGTDITGALWSGTQVNVRCGVTINAAIFNSSTCSTPNVNAGSDKTLTCSTTSIQLTGSSSTSGVSYSWVASNGGSIASGANTATPTVNAAGTYTLTVTTSTGGCHATDVALVSLVNTLPNVSAGTDKQLTCSQTTVQLSGSSSTTGVTYSWVASNGGNIVSGASTPTPTVNAAGTYTLKVTKTSTGCYQTDIALVTFSGTLPDANAGPDKQLTCTNSTVQLSGSSASTNVTFSWTASNGGNIVSGGNTATPLVNAVGTYTLKVTKVSNGCTKTSVALVSMNNSAPSVNAGADKALSCAVPSITLVGSSSTLNAQFSWTAGNTGSILSGANSNSAIVNGVGNYTLTVTNPLNGCSASDQVAVNDGCILLYYPDDTIGKVNTKIGSELTSLYRNFNKNAADTTPFIFRLNKDSVWIEVIALAGQRSNLVSALLSSPYGMTDTINNGNSRIVTGKYPIKNLAKLDSLPISSMINYCRPLYAPSVLSIGDRSKGDSAMRADIARNGFNLSGNGIKVGLISDSYNTLKKANFDITNGELPGTGNPNGDLTNVIVLEECKFKSIDEGRAMAQIVYDVAPKASLHFRTGFNDANDFALGIKQLQQVGCKVIVDDVTYITEPFFTDGVVAQAVDAAAAAGVSYFSAAGNFGNKSYESTFNPAPTPAGLSGTAHNFAGGDILQKISFNEQGDYTIVLQWEDGIYSAGSITGTQNDLDIYLTDDAGKILVGYNRKNTGQDPLEVLPISVPTASAVANIMIVRASGTGNVKFKYVVFRGDVTFIEHGTLSSTIVGQSNANGAIAVAAMRYDKANLIEDFSSLGGTTVNGSVRNKPDVTAPDGVNTTINFGTVFNDGDNIPNFFGTSAAAPHAAASAALIMEARTKFYSQAVTASDMKTLLKSTAKDIGAAGFDFLSGSGLVQTDAAIRTFASPEAIIDTLIVPAGITPGTQAFSVSITGRYMNAQSKVFLNGVQVPTAYVSSNQVNATIPLFNGNPPVTVYNPPTVPNMNDGGFSNELRFNSLKKVVITVDNKTKKYGEMLPVFTSTVTVNGQTLAASGLSLAALKLSNLVYTTSATNMSDAVTLPYYIHVENGSPLNAALPADALLMETYSYSYIDGNLNIERLPLTINSRDTTLVYGQKIDGQSFEYNYVFDNSKIAPADRAAFLNGVKTEHETAITNAVALVDERIVNGATGRVVTNSDLLNLSLAASSGAITNGRILNGQGGNSSLIVDLAPQSVFDFIDNVDPLQLISGFAGENPRSLLDGDVITNRATGRVVTNGATGRVVTNRATGRVVTNSTPGTNSNKKLAFLIDSIDVFDTITHEIESINSIHLITGTTVGTWRMTPAAFISDNFDVSYGIGALTITKAPLTIAADNKNKFYGSPNPPFTLTYSGFVNGDDESSVIPPVVSSPALTTSPAGSYLIKVNGGTSSNYTLTKVPGTLTIKKVVLTATADNKSKVYGTANPPLTISYTGFVNGEGVDSIASLPLAATSATVLSGVGNYAIALTGGSDNNYSFTKVNGTLSITKANLVAKADNKSKTYGSSNPTFTISYSGFVNGDDATSVSAPTASSSALKLSSVGNYPINLSGGSSSNYSFTYQSGTLTINPAALIVSADNKTIAAGASLPTFTYSTSGFVSNGANTVASGPQYAVSPVYSGAVGTYTITPSSLVLSQPNNYSISYVAGTLTVSTSTSSSKKIEVELECVDTLINDPSGFKYIARFEYENDNCYSVTIPIGSDNSLVGTYSGTQPSVFLPGENYFNVKFNGSLLTWTVKSYEGTTKKTSTASATKSSRSCYCSSSRLAFVSESMEEVESTTFSLYPNPSSDKIYVSSSFEFTSETSISVLDIVGREQFAQRVVKKDGNKFEMDIHSLTKGIYFVKITNGLEQFTIRFVKE